MKERGARRRTRRHQQAERADNGQVQRRNAGRPRRVREQKRRPALRPLERVVMQRFFNESLHLANVALSRLRLQTSFLSRG